MSYERGLDRCGCCEGISGLTPLELSNRPGLAELAYRIGTHGSFKSSMLARLGTRPRLRALTTRQADDLGVAIIDAWAVVLDILTFYQERIANEGYLGTADERRSLLELARLIGYELSPGVAASTFLAFTLDGNEGSPTEIAIRAGTKVQSIPGQDELPQTFETAADLTARPEWSALEPRLTHTQHFHDQTRVFFVDGIATQLEKGDPVLLVSKMGQTGEHAEQQLVPLKVIDVDTFSDAERGVQWTKLTLDVNVKDAGRVAPYVLGHPLHALLSYEPVAFTGNNMGDLLQKTWSSGTLGAFTQVQGWPLGGLGSFLAANRAVRPGVAVDDGLYAMRTTASAFGHNAPRWATLPAAWRDAKLDSAAPYTNNWDAGGASTPRVNQTSLAQPHTAGADVVYLDREYPEVVEGSFAVVTAPQVDPQVFVVSAANTESRADFGLNAKSRKLTLTTVSDAMPSDVARLADFRFRDASVHVESERLELVELPIEDPVAGDVLELEQVDLRLEPGRTVVVRGERADLAGVLDSETAVIREAELVNGYTRLTLEQSLRHAYVRTRTTIYANVAFATHGESKRQVLGSGDASRSFQGFELKQAPLTYVPARVPSGVESSAALRVDGVLWHESPDFFRLGPDEQSYVLRRDDDGNARVLFGDGRHGSRLPTGRENVVLDYRVGIGTAGHVAADRITLLASPPLGVRSVTNPIAASGGENPEQRDDARDNAPITVRTLDRIVSLTDFADFARGYGGIAKARADWVWDGARRLVFVTVSGADGDKVSGTLLADLGAAMDRYRDPFQAMAIGNYRSLFFTVEAELEIDADRAAADVLTSVEIALRRRFGFRARGFAQGVHPSEVIALMHGVPGVVGVDLNVLDLVPVGAGSAAPARIDATPPEPGVDAAGDPVVLGAQLLLLTPEPLKLEAKP